MRARGRVRAPGSGRRPTGQRKGQGERRERVAWAAQDGGGQLRHRQRELRGRALRRQRKRSRQETEVPENLLGGAVAGDEGRHGAGSPAGAAPDVDAPGPRVKRGPVERGPLLLVRAGRGVAHRRRRAPVGGDRPGSWTVRINAGMGTGAKGEVGGARAHARCGGASDLHRRHGLRRTWRELRPAGSVGARARTAPSSARLHRSLPALQAR